jgi:ADP-heptose:LPS heptosyltransferase
MEVMDGLNWLPIYNGTATVELTPEVQMAITWTKRKMKEEAELLDLCKQHPGLLEAKEKFEIMLALTKNASIVA